MVVPRSCANAQDKAVSRITKDLNIESPLSNSRLHRRIRLTFRYLILSCSGLGCCKTSVKTGFTSALQARVLKSWRHVRELSGTRSRGHPRDDLGDVDG